MITISDYKIITSSSDDIGKKVMECLGQGYELYGSPFGIAHNPGWSVGQALIKRKKIIKTTKARVATLVNKGIQY